MKRWFSIIIVIIMMIMASLACRFPWQVETISDNGLATETPKTPADTATLPPVETATGTATISPSLTPTDEVNPSLPLVANPVIFNLQMFSPLQGWAVTRDRNHLLRTMDGGDTWEEATPSELLPLPAESTSLGIDPFFLDEDTAWFTPNSADDSVLYQTQDGGLSWRITPLPFNRARYFFLNINDGYALVDLGAGAGSQYVALHRTDDGGLTWTEVFSHEPGQSKSLPESGSKSGITFLDVENGWIGGTYPMEDYFYLHFTVDGGVSWTRETDISQPGAYMGSWLEVQQPFFMTNTVGYLPVRALTQDGDSYLLIYQSDDSGQTWTFQNSVKDGREINFINPDEGWITAAKSLFHTTDGGLNWSPLTISTGLVDEYILRVDFVDDQHGWIITTPDDSDWDPVNLYRTTDGGMNWIQLLP